jgi:hypothetical protein
VIKYKWRGPLYVYTSAFPVRDYNTQKKHCFAGPARNKLLLTTLEPLRGQTVDELEMPAVFKLFDATMGRAELSYSKIVL